MLSEMQKNVGKH